MTSLERAHAAAEPAATKVEASALDRAMSRYAEGDDAAFGEVFRALAPRLLTFLRRLCGSPELAQDLLQETFLRMHRARGSFEPGGAVVPWAYAIARNCFVSQTRALKSRAARSSLDIADHDVPAGLDANAEENAAVRQSAELVERALAQMSVTNREAFVLIRFEGQSVAAAAQILGASEGAVKLRAFRAYEILRAALASATAEACETMMTSSRRLPRE
jgi:RNA polymerase sigma-70 factor, ECF subfamily